MTGAFYQVGIHMGTYLFEFLLVRLVDLVELRDWDAEHVRVRVEAVLGVLQKSVDNLVLDRKGVVAQVSANTVPRDELALLARDWIREVRGTRSEIFEIDVPVLTVVFEDLVVSSSECVIEPVLDQVERKAKLFDLILVVLIRVEVVDRFTLLVK
jgi:hypothetical protein